MDLKAFTKIVLCGSSTVGKTTIFNRIVTDEQVDQRTTSTTGASFAAIQMDYRDEKLNINFWDTAGQEEYRSLVNLYFRSSNIVIIVFDLTKHESFEQVDEWVDLIQENCGEPSPRIIVVGNKSDLIEQRKVTQEEIDMFLNDTNNKMFPYYEISAKKGSNMDILMENIAYLSHELMEQRNKENRNEMRDAEVQLRKGGDEKEMKKKSCCSK